MPAPIVRAKLEPRLSRVMILLRLCTMLALLLKVRGENARLIHAANNKGSDIQQQSVAAG